MLSALTLLAVLQSKAVLAKPALLSKLSAKIAELGETSPIDKDAAAFLKLKSKDVKWHSRFDSERQVQLYTGAKSQILIFYAPEKPFPEFGKTWLYGVGLNGRLINAGICEPRSPYKEFADVKINEKNAQIEINFWLKVLEIH